MRICLISNTTLANDPRAIAEAEILRLAGHEVVGAASRDDGYDWISGARPATFLDRIARRGANERIATVGAALEADLYQPTHPSATETAVEATQGAGSSVLVKPGWPRPSAFDLIDLAPSDPMRALPSSGELPLHHSSETPNVRRVTGEGRVVVAYRKSERSPGRYIVSALQRAGLQVRHCERIDWSTIDPGTRALIVVESPLPALPIHGENPGVPVIFWVHHGEHHLHANTRLQRLYGAHAVALAHSWHLAHYFTGFVDRLPFGVAPELFPDSFRPHAERRWDVGFVGALSDGDGRYSRRESLLHELEGALGSHRVAIRSDVTPTDLAALYRESRVVVDDGAGPHLPITMRVFEATGAGALLFTNEAPGLTRLLRAEEDYLPLTDSRSVLSALESDTETIARSAHRQVWSRHTYDQRAAELLEIAEHIAQTGSEPPERELATDGTAAVIARFPDAQRVLDLGGSVTDQLPGREVWDYEIAEERAVPNTFHITAISGGTREQRARAIAAARIGVVVSSADADAVAAEVGSVRPDAHRHDLDTGTAFTFGDSGYRVTPDPNPR